MAAVITRTRVSVSCLRVAKAAAQIPHTLFFYLRRREKGSAGASYVAAKPITRHSQTMIGVPGKQDANQKEKNEDQGRDEKEKERSTRKQQTPVEPFLPGGINAAQEVAQAQTIQGQPRQTDVRELLIIITGKIARYAAGSLCEYRRILQILAGKGMPLRIAQDNPIGGIYDNPAAIQEHFGDYMLGSAFGSQ